jgi:hypothetical protein
MKGNLGAVDELAESDVFVLSGVHVAAKCICRNSRSKPKLAPLLLPLLILTSLSYCL